MDGDKYTANQSKVNKAVPDPNNPLLSMAQYEDNSGEYNPFGAMSDITIDENGWEKETKKDGKVKTMFQLVDPYFYEGIADILTLGAQKYKPNNWMDGNHTEYSRAVESHWNEYKKGNKTDKESGKSHLYHIACNIMFLDYFDRKNEELEEIKAEVHENMTRMNLEALR